jgi:hypothetical protein
VGANVGRIDPNLSRPYSNDLVFGIEASPRTGVVLRLEALGRWEKDLLGIVNQSSAEPKYTIVNVNDPGYDLEHSTDDEVLSVFSLAPSALPWRFDNMLTNPAGRTARRLGVKLTLEVRTNRLFFLLGVRILAEGAASNRGFLDSETIRRDRRRVARSKLRDQPERAAVRWSRVHRQGVNRLSLSVGRHRRSDRAVSGRSALRAAAHRPGPRARP